MKREAIIADKQLELTLKRLAYQLIEVHGGFADTVLVGIQPRGVPLAERLCLLLETELGGKPPLGRLDVTFHRDDFRRREVPKKANMTDMPFLVEGKKVVLVDDVFYTGRTVRAAMDAMAAFGRPKEVEFLCLVERRYARHLPVQADYVGRSVHSSDDQTIKVEWKSSGMRKDAIYIQEKGQG